MTDLVVEAHGLRKTFRDGARKVVAVDGLDLSVERGGVHGFLGPNGSGKTTTIRMLLGLSKPDRGEISVLGAQLPGALDAVSPRVGAVVESPRFSPDLTGRRNLQLLAGLAGLPAARADAALERVALADRGKDRFGGYSLGMRQRLGVAAGLLKEPELLVLDEPTNGLDPAGILDMRELIRGLGESGITVLLSSHILAEVQQVCSAVSIIGDGRLLAGGKVDDLLGEGVVRTRIAVADQDRAATLLTEGGYQVTRDDGALLVEGHEHPEEIVRLLALQELYATDVRAVRPTLETFFLALTGHRPEPGDDPDADEAAERLGSGAR
ncbi:MAG: ABC transporter ATP-binding protein [Nocardioidaceae bacterium]|nr:ABC transporter ATP-binding protein [Nocardioidaceae bacterium]